MAVLALVIVALVVAEANSLRQEQDRTEPESAGAVVRRWLGDVRLRRHFYTTVALIALIALAPVVGWTVSSTAFVVGLMVALGVRSVPALVMYGLGSAAFNYFALMESMGLPLPRGFLF
jgi:hypothetical protein